MRAGVLERIPAAMQRYVDECGYAGISVLVARRGKVAARACVGLQDREAGLPMTAETIVRLYSMTKPVVSVAVMTLVDEGRIGLDDRVARYLPAFGRVKVLTEDGAQVETARPITVRDLLTHTAGLTNELQLTAAAGEYRRARIHYDAGRSLAQMIDELAALPLAFQPGSMWHYSPGIDVAARIVEIVTDQPFQELLAERILDPLGMVDTGYVVPTEKAKRLAAVYGLPDVFAEGLTLEAIGSAAAAGSNERRDVSATHPTDAPGVFVRGGYGLCGTIDDYFQFAQMLANHGELEGARILSARGVEEMHTNQLAAPLLPFSQFGVVNNGWGFGLGSAVLLDPVATGAPGSVGEHGWPGAANTYFWVDPHQQLVGVLMAQYMLGFAGPERELRALVYESLAD